MRKDRNLDLQTTQDILESLCQLQRSADARAACRVVLDLILDITGLEKGYVFGFEFVGNEIRLLEKASSDPRKNSSAGEYQISQSKLQEVISGNGKILFYRDDMSNAPTTESIIKYHLKSVICVPLINSKNIIVGIVYADSTSTPLEQIEPFEPLLRNLSRLLMFRLQALEGSKLSSFINATKYFG